MDKAVPPVNNFLFTSVLYFISSQNQKNRQSVARTRDSCPTQAPVSAYWSYPSGSPPVRVSAAIPPKGR